MAVSQHIFNCQLKWQIICCNHRLNRYFLNYLPSQREQIHKNACQIYLYLMQKKRVKEKGAVNYKKKGNILIYDKELLWKSYFYEILTIFWGEHWIFWWKSHILMKIAHFHNWFLWWQSLIFCEIIIILFGCEVFAKIGDLIQKFENFTKTSNFQNNSLMIILAILCMQSITLKYG